MLPPASASVASGLVSATGIHHLGVAVSDLEEAVDTYRRLFGAEVESRETIEEQGVEAAMLRVGSGRIELLASSRADSSVGKFLESRGPGMHHVAFGVDDVARELDQLAAAGAELIDETPRRGMGGMDIAFIHPHATGGVLAELVANG
jgi:methylmalonyl-CoA/ethylmalonyl-CoA epimerase